VSRAVDAVAAALRRFNGRRVDLLVGEPCFDPPVEIVRAFSRSAGTKGSGYGPPGGLAELRELLAAGISGDRSAPDQVVVTHGAKGGLLVLLAVLVQPGDEVVHPLPCYPAYPAMVRRFGGTPIAVAERGDGFAGWVEAVAARVSSRTRAVVLASPSNPTGTMLTEIVLTSLVGLCRERGVRLILDEAYAAFGAGGGGQARLDDIDPTLETVVRVRSASKTFALCGWRIGWLVTDRQLSRRVEAMQSALLNPPATPPQIAMLALPEVPDRRLEANRRQVRERLEGMAATLLRAGLEADAPDGGFYLWVDVRSRLDGDVADSAAWCEALARDRGVGLWPGEDFGGPGFVRLAVPRGPDWRADLVELERRLAAEG
jgi:aspartate aminotransferase